MFLRFRAAFVENLGSIFGLRANHPVFASSVKDSTAIVEKKFDPALSGLRGAASFGVVLFHASIFIPMPLRALTSTFYLGVPIFLMMSMYLLLKRLDSNSNLKYYFARRIIRIWPIYYGCLIVFYLIFHFPFWAFVRYLFFAEYYVNPFGYFPVSIFWTLQVEEAMYLFIPLIHKSNSKTWISLAFIMNGLIFLLLSSRTPSSDYNPAFFQMFLPMSLMAYGFGILAYLGKIPSKLGWLSAGGIVGYTILNLLYFRSVELGYYQNFITSNIILYFTTLIGFSSVVSKPARLLGWLSFLGEESYALYAIHFAFVTIFGLKGVIYALLLAFAIEFSLRPREITRRLSLSYTCMIRSISSGEGSTQTRGAESWKPLVEEKKNN